MMRRREFITLLGGAVAWPIAARAQAERMRRLGVLMSVADDDEGQARIKPFQQTLRELGWVEGRNIQIDYRWTEGDAKRIPRYASELVALRPDVIFETSSPVLAALKRATSTIPIVFVNVSDPVGQGFVASFAQPGGNITGFTNYEPSMVAKWLEALRELSPRAERVLAILNPDTTPSKFYVSALEAAAASFRMKPVVVLVHASREIEPAMASFVQEPHGVMIVMPDAFAVAHSQEYVQLAARYRLPTAYGFSTFARAGGLLAYSLDVPDHFRRAAQYVDRILRGASPGGLPVQAPTKFEFIINMRTAKALGIEVPPSILLRADEVIE
jgi:putative ABC transport system substrate-binding protein